MDQGEAPPEVPQQWGMGFFKGPASLMMITVYLSMILTLLKVF